MAKHCTTSAVVLGADLATPENREVRIDRISEEEITFLEKLIDKMDDELPQLKNFILPGGTQAAASIHHARTVCRRAERLTVACGTEEEISELTVKYLNRLSDFCLCLADTKISNQVRKILPGFHVNLWPKRSKKVLP